MSNTLIRGGAPAVQVAGANGQGVFLQNLGTAPLFLGYRTGINSGDYDGVIAAGGAYTAGPNRPVFLFASVDTPVVYNDDPSASADAGTTVSGSLNVAGGSLDSIAQTVAVAGTVKAQQMAQVTLLASMDFTCPTTGVQPTGVSDLTVNGLNQFASVLISIDTLTNIINIPAPSLTKALQGQFLWAPGTANGGSETVAYWHLARLIRMTDFIQLPCVNDALELTFSPTAAPASAVRYLVSVYGSNLYIPKLRYSQGGGNGTDPTQLYWGSYSAVATNFDYVGSTSGRFFANLRSNSTAGASRLYPFAIPWSQAIMSAQYQVNTQPAVSFPMEFPGPLAPIGLQTSVITAGAVNITSQAEAV